jgi:hypothetical protein
MNINFDKMILNTFLNIWKNESRRIQIKILKLRLQGICLMCSRSILIYEKIERDRN